MTVNIHYTRLYADEQGASHFENVQQPLSSAPFAPPAGDLFTGQLSNAENVFWVHVLSDWRGDVAHPAPRRQLFVTVAGSYEIEASDGEQRAFPTGSVLLLEDTHGQGHRTRILNESAATVLGIALKSETLPIATPEISSTSTIHPQRKSS